MKAARDFGRDSRGTGLVRPEGLEPPTGGLEIRCSVQLSYGRAQGLIQARPSVLQHRCRCSGRGFGYLLQGAACPCFGRLAQVTEGYDADQSLLPADDRQATLHDSLLGLNRSWFLVLAGETVGFAKMGFDGGQQFPGE